MNPLLLNRHRFRACIGIDWSGAAEYRAPKDHPDDYPIQMAGVRTDDGKAALWKAPGNDGVWTRGGVVAHLLDRLSQPNDDPRPVVIGFDFAFAFPFVDKKAYFPDLFGAPETWADLLWRVRARVTPENDFAPGPFVTDDAFAPFFLNQEKRGALFTERLRETDKRERLHSTTATSVFKMVGPGQVGKGSVAGMACLHELRQKLGDKLHVWPFDGLKWGRDVRAVIVEVFPRIMYPLCETDPALRDDAPRFHEALKAIGVEVVWRPDAGAPTSYGENAADALVTAAALYRFGNDGRTWHCPMTLGKKVYETEGWIWGAGVQLVESKDPAVLKAKEERAAERAEWAAAREAELRAAVPTPEADWRFWMARGVLAEVASTRRTISYHEAAALCGLYEHELFPFLKHMHKNPISGEPDLSAVVVGAEGHPGKGWGSPYGWNKEKKARWEAARDAVYELWGRRRGLLMQGLPTDVAPATGDPIGEEGE